MTQPLLAAAALLVAEHLGRPHIAAGHSVGEMAAGAIAGVVSPDDAIRLTGIRGRAMAQAACRTPTGMTAVVGGDRDDVLAAIAEHGLTPANINASEQVVVAGTIAQLQAFAAKPPQDARLRPLRVAGAFHTMHMAPAIDVLAAAAAGVPLNDPAITLLSNRDGGVVTSGAEWLNNIAAQVAAPVRWDLCMQSMASLGATAAIELPPAGILTGLARRAMPDVRLLPLEDSGPAGDRPRVIAEATDNA